MKSRFSTSSSNSDHTPLSLTSEPLTPNQKSGQFTMKTPKIVTSSDLDKLHRAKQNQIRREEDPSKLRLRLTSPVLIIERSDIENSV